MGFFLDLTDKHLEIFEHHPEDTIEPSDFDWREFQTEDEADVFLAKYKAALKGLKRLPAETMPCMLLKRRYMVLTKMGLKAATKRHYLKPWKPGQIFYFYDQTFYLTVKLTGINQESPRSYRYEFEVVE